MGNTLDSLVYRMERNDPELLEISFANEGIEEVSDEDATTFAIALTLNETLTSLDLSGLKLGDLWAEMLANALILNDTLTVLRLHKNKIHDGGAKSLLAAMRHNHTLTALYIAMNSIQDPCINDELQKLIDWNKMGAEEAARQKAASFGSGWVAEAIKLRRQAETELRRTNPTPVALAPPPKESSYVCSPYTKHAAFVVSSGHKKVD